MKEQTIRLPYTPYIDLVVLADLHIGDPAVDEQAIKDRIQQCMKPGVYAILNGDLINNAVVGSVSDTYSERMNPQQAIDKVVRLLEPLAKRGKILCITDGNHERRTWKQVGVSPTWMIAEKLGITDRLSYTSILLHLTIGKQTYSIYVTHGAGGGKKISGKTAKIDSLADIVDADIYIMSHVHQSCAFRRAYYRIINGRAIKNEKLFVLTSSVLDYDGYADVAGFQPASTINPVISLAADQKFAAAMV